jgi:hypothetical protein
MDHLLGGGKPSFHLWSFEFFAEPAKGIFSAEATFAHAGDGGHRPVVLQTSAMGETSAANQTVERESLEDVGHGGGVGTGAWQRITGGKLGNHSAAFQKVVPCEQTAIRREGLVTAAQVKLPARRLEFEIQFSFTHWVNQ